MRPPARIAALVLLAACTTPALPEDQRKTAARVMRIEEMHKRLSKLEKKLDQE